jgi:hypothetical protein
MVGAQSPWRAISRIFDFAKIAVWAWVPWVFPLCPLSPFNLSTFQPFNLSTFQPFGRVVGFGLWSQFHCFPAIIFKFSALPPMKKPADKGDRVLPHMNVPCLILPPAHGGVWGPLWN